MISSSSLLGSTIGIKILISLIAIVPLKDLKTLRTLSTTTINPLRSSLS